MSFPLQASKRRGRVVEIAKFLGTLTIQADKKSLKKPLISRPKKRGKRYFLQGIREDLVGNEVKHKCKSLMLSTIRHKYVASCVYALWPGKKLFFPFVHFIAQYREKVTLISLKLFWKKNLLYHQNIRFVGNRAGSPTDCIEKIFCR